MRTRIALALVVCLSLVAAYGVVASGAEFTSKSVATQTLTIGELKVLVTSTTPDVVITATSDGVTTVACPAFAVTTSSGPTSAGITGPSCNIQLTNIGTIAPLNLSVFLQATTTGAHLSRYAVIPVGIGAPVRHVLSTASTPIAVLAPPAFPVSIDFPVVWGYDNTGALALDNSDFNTSVTITYTLQITQ